MSSPGLRELHEVTIQGLGREFPRPLPRGYGTVRVRVWTPGVAAPVAKRLPRSSQGGHGPIRAEQFAVTLLGGRVWLLSGPRAKSSIPCRQHAVAGAAVTSAGEEQSSPRCGPRCGPRREGRCPSAPGASPRPRRVTMS